MTAAPQPGGAPGTMPLGQAVRRFLCRDAFEPATRVAYGRTLAALTDQLGAGADVAAITLEELETLLDGRWADAAATTYNRHRAALVSFLGWCTKRGWAAGNVAVLVESRKVRRRSEDARRERPLDRSLLTELWALDGVGARDRLLWRMAYETWARAEELLGLDVRDLGLGRREGMVHAKGGDVETIWWAAGTARLLLGVVAGRTAGPLFLATHRPHRPMPATDVDPVTGRTRLSYRQAERQFSEAGVSTRRARRGPCTGCATRDHPRRRGRLEPRTDPGQVAALLAAPPRALREPVGRRPPGHDGCARPAAQTAAPFGMRAPRSLISPIGHPGLTGPGPAAPAHAGRH